MNAAVLRSQRVVKLFDKRKLKLLTPLRCHNVHAHPFCTFHTTLSVYAIKIEMQFNATRVTSMRRRRCRRWLWRTSCRITKLNFAAALPQHLTHSKSLIRLVASTANSFYRRHPPLTTNAIATTSVTANNIRLTFCLNAIWALVAVSCYCLLQRLHTRSHKAGIFLQAARHFPRLPAS